MGNKIKYGLKNVHVAILTTDGSGGYTYDTPVAIPGAVSLSLDAETDSSPFYADDLVYYRAVTLSNYNGDLELALVTDWFRENILKETKDTNGVLIENNLNVEPVHFAMLFEFSGDVKAIRHVLYNCSVSNRASLESSTKEDTIEPGTETLEITADPRTDGLIKARTGDDTSNTVYDNWYQSVYTPGSIVVASAKLSALTIGSLSLSPTFSANVASYTTSTDNAFDTVSATGADGASVTITVNGTTHTNGAAAAWNTGVNTVTISVSKSGLTTSTYTVTVTKSAATNLAKLSALTLSGNNVLSPTFDPDVTSYTVNTSASAISLTATGADGATTAISSGGYTYTSGDSIMLSVGANEVTITVSKEGLTTSTYTVTITKAAG